ncbi:MAG TPA: BON domain-containing protein [Candidatus Acidoferrum sp.]
MRKFKIGAWGSFLAALFLAGSFTVSCSLLAPDDAAITKGIKAKIASASLPKKASIEVTTHGRVVTLTGQVPDDFAQITCVPGPGTRRHSSWAADLLLISRHSSLQQGSRPCEVLQGRFTAPFAIGKP